jgi:AcrR family transcriptional regulator
VKGVNMVQYKKDNIKEKIDSAALKIFGEKGYENTKISDISIEAKVSVGNIYRYYKSKEEIFYSVAPESVLEKLKSILINKVILAKNKELNGGKSISKFHLINEEFVEYFISNKEQVLIMVNGSKGTRYEGIKDEIVNYMIETVKKHYLKEKDEIIRDSINYDIIKMIYEKLIEMMMHVLRESKSPEDIKKSFEIINSYHLFGVINLFK